MPDCQGKNEMSPVESHAYTGVEGSLKIGTTSDNLYVVGGLPGVAVEFSSLYLLWLKMVLILHGCSFGFLRIIVPNFPDNPRQLCLRLLQQ
jgi:hypothetical protein